MVNATLNLLFTETTISVTLLAVGISVIIVVVIGMFIGCVCICDIENRKNALAKFNLLQDPQYNGCRSKKAKQLLQSRDATKYVTIE